MNSRLGISIITFLGAGLFLSPVVIYWVGGYLLSRIFLPYNIVLQVIVAVILVVAGLAAKRMLKGTWVVPLYTVLCTLGGLFASPLALQYTVHYQRFVYDPYALVLQSFIGLVLVGIGVVSSIDEFDDLDDQRPSSTVTPTEQVDRRSDE